MSTDSVAVHQELVEARKLLRSGAHLERAPREERQRRALARRVFHLALELHWCGYSGPSVSGTTSSPLPLLDVR